MVDEGRPALRCGRSEGDVVSGEMNREQEPERGSQDMQEIRMRRERELRLRVNFDKRSRCYHRL